MQRDQRVYVPGFMNWVMAQIVRFTPRNMVTLMVKQMSKPSSACPTPRWITQRKLCRTGTWRHNRHLDYEADQPVNR